MLSEIIVHFIIGGLTGGLITLILLTILQYVETRKRNRYHKSLNSTILHEMKNNNESLIKIIEANEKKLAEYK